MNSPESEPIPPVPAEENDATPLYTLSVDDVSRLFSDAGVPRAPRTVMRYCQHGALACIKADTEHGERYAISRESVDNRIKEMQQLAVSRPDESRRDASRQDAPAGEPRREDVGEETAPETKGVIKKLEAQVRDLEVTNRYKDYALEKLEEDRAMLLELVSTKSHRIGQLETRLELGAGTAASAPELPAAEAELPRQLVEDDLPAPD